MPRTRCFRDALSCPDNAKAYTDSRAFLETLAGLGARQILIPPRTPRWNGKVERFIRTLDEEWAHARIWPSSAPEAVPFPHGCGTTTAGDPTARSGTNRRSAAFSKTVGSTARTPRG